MFVTDHLLKKEHEQAGLALQDDEDFIYLVHHGRVVATWNSRYVLPGQIQHEADQYLEWENSGINFNPCWN